MRCSGNGGGLALDRRRGDGDADEHAEARTGRPTRSAARSAPPRGVGEPQSRTAGSWWWSCPAGASGVRSEPRAEDPGAEAGQLHAQPGDRRAADDAVDIDLLGGDHRRQVHGLVDVRDLGEMAARGDHLPQVLHDQVEGGLLAVLRGTAPRDGPCASAGARNARTR